MEKSYVTVEQERCVICDKVYDTGSVLLDQRLRKKFEHHTVTGLGLCEDHYKEGYVPLIEIDSSKLTKKQIYMLGGLVYIKKETCFNAIPNKYILGNKPRHFVFIDSEAYNSFKETALSLEED